MATANIQLDPKRLKQDFPIFKRLVHGKPLIYLDNAATTQRPQSVLDAITHFYTECNANVHRGVHTLAHEATVLYEDAHKKVAQFVNAYNWREVLFTRNTTESINLVAYSWGWKHLKAGDEVVLSVMEHHSDLVPWYLLRDRVGFTIKFLGVNQEGKLRLDELDELLSERTRLVCLTHASNITGVINPVAEVVKKVHGVGALCLLDAAQSVPHFALDVQALGVDFLAASGHKMLGPTGIGFLWGRRELLSEMDPFMGGGEMIETVTLDGATWNALPWKFEAGTGHIAGGIGLGAAVDYLERLGMDNVLAHEQQLLAYALEQLGKIDKLTLYGPPADAERLAVFPFNVEGVHPHDVAYILDQQGIAVRSGHHCAQPFMNAMGIDNNARASFYLYNDKHEVDALVEAIEQVKRTFKV